MARGIAERYLGGIGPQFGILFLAFGAGAFFGDFSPERDVDRYLLVTHRLHGALAFHRHRDIRRELFLLLLFMHDFARPKFRHHIAGEQFERFADMLVLVAAALLDEHGLVDA